MINKVFLKALTSGDALKSRFCSHRERTGPLQAPRPPRRDYFSPAERCSFDVGETLFF